MSRHSVKTGRKPKLVISSEKRKRARLLFDESPSKRSKHSHTDSGRDTRSPEPNCPICLGRVEGKCFAHGCFHSFCRTCLSEWAKVKAECPVCREPFDKIIYNVKSLSQYDEVPVPPRPAPSSGSLFSGISFPLEMYFGHNLFHHHLDHIAPYHMPVPGAHSAGRGAAASAASSASSTYRNPHTLPTSPNISMSSFSIQIDTDSSSSIVVHSGRSHRHSSRRTGDHSYGPTATTSHDLGLGVSVEDMFRPMLRLNPQPRPGSNDFRRHVYRADLWFKFPVWDTQTRECSAQFYRSNTAATFRLHEFIRRDLRVIIRSQSEVNRVHNLIVAALTTDDIRSRSFRRLIETHTLTNTDHFIHELYCFAVSPIESMEQYDFRAVYVSKGDTNVQTTIPPVPPLGFMYELHPDDDQPDSSRRPFGSQGRSGRPSTTICITISDSESDDEGDQRRPFPSNRPAAAASATVTSVDTLPQPQTSSSPDLIEVEDETPHAEEQQLIVEPVELDNENMLSINVNFIDDFDNPTPGPSGINTSIVLPINLTNDHYADSDSDTEIDVGNDVGQRSLTDFVDEEDEVEVVGTVKARHERTPEVFELSDDDDDDCPEWDQHVRDMVDFTTKLEADLGAKDEQSGDVQVGNETEVTDNSDNLSGDKVVEKEECVSIQEQEDLAEVQNEAVEEEDGAAN